MRLLRDIEIGLAASDPEERRQATARLAEIGPDGTIELIIQALGDEDWRVRKEATAVARSLAPAPELLRALVTALQPGENVGLRNAAVEALGGFGADAVDALAMSIHGLDADGRKLAAEALARSDHPSALMVLRGLLQDEDPNVRAGAVEAIAQIGATAPEEAMAVLQICLHAEDRFQRLVALDGLNQLGVELPWTQIEALLSDPILERSALAAAGRSADPRAAPLLVQAMERMRGTSFVATLRALADLVRVGDEAKTAAQAALQSLSKAARQQVLECASPENEDTETRRLAMLVLGALATPEAVELAVQALQDDLVAAEAEEALGMLGPLGLDALIAAAHDPNPLVRAVAIELVGRFVDTQASEHTLRAIRDGLTVNAPEVVRAALEASASVGNADFILPIAEWLGETAPPALRKAAEVALASIARRHPETARQLCRRAAPDGSTVLAAAVITGALPSPVRETVVEDVEFLSAALSNESSLVRRAAIDALAAIGSSLGAEAVAFALTDEERDVQVAAVRALGRMRSDDGNVAGLKHLLALVERSKDAALLSEAVRALGDAADPRALPVLRPLAKSAAPMVAVAAVEAIGKFPEARRIEALIDALLHQDSEVVKAALRVLVEERDARVAAHVGACLDHAAWDVRRLSADLLGRIGGESNVQLLRTKLAIEEEPLVREAILRALESTGALRRTPVPPGTGSWRP